jgi:hypothetical protein
LGLSMLKHLWFYVKLRVELIENLSSMKIGYFRNLMNTHILGIMVLNNGCK